MKKIDLSARLSKKNTIIAIVCVFVFLVCGILAAVLGHKAYLTGCEAKITNVSSSPSSSLFSRPDGLTIVYAYSTEEKQVKLGEVLSLSKGATMTIKTVTDASGKVISRSGDTFEVAENERYIVFIAIKSNGGLHENGYVLDIVSADEYSDETPDFIKDVKVIKEIISID